MERRLYAATQFDNSQNFILTTGYGIGPSRETFPVITMLSDAFLKGNDEYIYNLQRISRAVEGPGRIITPNEQ